MEFAVRSATPLRLDFWTQLALAGPVWYPSQLVGTMDLVVYCSKGGALGASLAGKLNALWTQCATCSKSQSHVMMSAMGLEVKPPNLCKLLRFQPSSVTEYNNPVTASQSKTWIFCFYWTLCTVCIYIKQNSFIWMQYATGTRTRLQPILSIHLNA